MQVAGCSFCLSSGGAGVFLPLRLSSSLLCFSGSFCLCSSSWWDIASLWSVVPCLSLLIYVFVSLFIFKLVLGGDLGHYPLRSVLLFVLAVLPPGASAFLSLWLWVLGYFPALVCVPPCCVCGRWVVAWVSNPCGLSFYLSLLSFFFVLSARQNHR